MKIAHEQNFDFLIKSRTGNILIVPSGYIQKKKNTGHINMIFYFQSNIPVPPPHPQKKSKVIVRTAVIS